MKKKQQQNELPLERGFHLEEMRRFLNSNPEEAAETALEIYEAYLNLDARHHELKVQNHQLRLGIRTRVETPPFFQSVHS